MAYGISLSGLQSASEAIDVTSNNIANVGTSGFKKSRASFGDIFASSSATLASSALTKDALACSYVALINSCADSSLASSLSSPVILLKKFVIIIDA